MRKLKNARGVTLSELLISFALLLLATAMMMALFVPSMSLFRRQTGKSDSYRACLVLIDKFRVGIMNSMLETMTVSSDGRALSWQMAQLDPPFSSTTGEPIMTGTFAVMFYRADEQRVYLTEHDSTSASGSDLPGFLSTGELAAACVPNTSRCRVLANKIVEFKVTDKDGDPAILEPPLSLYLRSEVDTKGTETNNVEDFDLQVNVSPRSMRW